MNTTATSDSRALTLEPTQARALASLVGLAGLALVLPVLAHGLGLPVRLLLPMHWPVLMAGITYGWRAGGLIGAAVPILSHSLSGFPTAGILPSMVAEVGTYGLAAGVARQTLRLPGTVAVLLAVLSGRLVFVVSVFLTGGSAGSSPEYFLAALLPGVWGAGFQVLALPGLSRWWVRRERSRNVA